MKKRFLALTLTLCLLSTFSVPAAALETQRLNVIVNDAVIDLDTSVLAENGVTYVPFWNIVKALYPTAVLEQMGEASVATAPGLTLKVQAGRNYLEANERCLYLSKGVRTASDGTLLLPSRVLGTALGADVAWDPVGYHVVFTAGDGPIPSGNEVYHADDLYWLSRIIYAESGNQPLKGKIAVGNVVLNRVASSNFPDSVKEVIFQKNQFSPVASGSIYRSPNEESVAAAKLCLDGANTIGSALFFFNPDISGNCWAARNRTYVATIGAHDFYA